MSRKIIGLRSLLSALALLLFLSLPVRGCCQGEGRKRVLLISSYFPDKENSGLIINSFSHALDALADCRLTVEYMDSESATEYGEWTRWMTQLFDAYRNPPDAVVILGGEGWAAYKATCPSAWRRTPVVLGFMKQGVIDYEHHAPQQLRSVQQIGPTESSFGDFRVTGYYVKDYFRENLALIRRLQPEVRAISFIYDNRYRFEFLTPFLEKMVLEAGFDKLHACYGTELTTAQLVDTLAGQDATHAVFSAGWYTDRNSYPHSYAMLHNELSLRRRSHFYLIMDQGQSNPTYLGGYYVAAEDIGRDLAGLAGSVLRNGFEHSPSFGLTPSEPKYYINCKALRASGIDPSRLPAGTVLYNREPSFWETYMWQTMLAGLVVVSILLLLLVRMSYYRRLTRAKARMAEQQRVLREKADESNRLKSAFLANMSHEIRTPLNAIVGFSNQLALTDDKEEAKMYMDIIQTNNELLLQLVGDILDLSKIEAGQLDFVFSEVDAVELCRHLEQIYRSRLKQGVVLRCEVPDAECVLITERNRVTQVLSNFLSNAAKFTDAGTIRLGYEHAAEGLRFFVEDTGKGIAPENLARIFDRFQKFDHFVSGNGLGMAISKGIADKLGGRIEVRSEPGRGSVFMFLLPCDILRSTKAGE